MTIKLAQFGLGPIGLETLRLAASKPWAKIIGGIDISPDKAGKDLGLLTGLKQLRGRRVAASLDELLAIGKPDLIFHTAVSKTRAAAAQLEPMARLGIHVVSSCEELVFPQLREPRLAAKLDRICRRYGARIVATDLNQPMLDQAMKTGTARPVDWRQADRERQSEDHGRVTRLSFTGLRPSRRTAVAGAGVGAGGVPGVCRSTRLLLTLGPASP